MANTAASWNIDRIRQFIRKVENWWIRQPWWPTETLCWLLSLSCFASIVGLLAVFNGQPYPHLYRGITLNALASVLAAIGTTSLSLTIATCISQVKWLWFRTSRPLTHFDALDQASRGPGGSFLLLAHARGGALGLLGAFLIIATLALSPFVQQVISYDTVPITNGEAHIPVLPSDGYLQPTCKNSSNPSLAATLLFASLQANPYKPDVTPFCPSGNCTFPPYQTLAFCEECRDISDHLDIQDNGSVAQLSNNFTMKYKTAFGRGRPSGIMMMWNVEQPVDVTCPAFYSKLVTNPYPYFESVAFKDRGFVIADYFILFNRTRSAFNTFSPNSESPGLPRRFIAVECMIQACVKTLRADITNGRLNEVEISRYTNNTPAARASIPFNHTRKVELWPPDSNEGFGARHLLKPIIEFSNSLMRGGGVISYDQFQFPSNKTQTAGNRTSDPNVARGMIMKFVIYVMQAAPAEKRLPDAISNAAASLAATATTWLRNYQRRTDATLFIPSNMTLHMKFDPVQMPMDTFLTRSVAKGTSWRNEVRVSIKWPWMSLPFAVLVLALLLLILTILGTRRADFKPWRDNTTAVMLHGLDEHARMLVEHAPGEQIYGNSQEMVVSMQRDKHGIWRLMAIQGDQDNAAAEAERRRRGRICEMRDVESSAGTLVPRIEVHDKSEASTSELDLATEGRKLDTTVDVESSAGSTVTISSPPSQCLHLAALEEGIQGMRTAAQSSTESMDLPTKEVCVIPKSEGGEK